MKCYVQFRDDGSLHSERRTSPNIRTICEMDADLSGKCIKFVYKDGRYEVHFDHAAQLKKEANEL